MYVMGSRLDPSELIDEANRFESLRDDFMLAAKGELPSGLSYKDAPFIEGWAIVHMTVPCLVGYVSGHPVLPGDRRTIATSQAWLMSSDHDWLRTQSRWYRLGRRGGAGATHG
jgi:hypothetical protein